MILVKIDLNPMQDSQKRVLNYIGIQKRYELEKTRWKKDRQRIEHFFISTFNGNGGYV